ncbi:MAG: peroxiredoxin family protein [Polyangiales bacterium]
MTEERRRRRSETVPEAPHAIATRRASQPSSPFSVDVGDAAPTFTLPNESGTAVPLAALRGGPVIVCFCPANQAPTVAADLALHRRTLGERGATGLLVIRGNKEDAAAIAEPHGREVVVLADADGVVHKAYGVLDPLLGRARLAVFLLDTRGDVASVWGQPDPTRSIPLAVEALDLAR